MAIPVTSRKDDYRAALRITPGVLNVDIELGAVVGAVVGDGVQFYVTAAEADQVRHRPLS